MVRCKLTVAQAFGVISALGLAKNILVLAHSDYLVKIPNGGQLIDKTYVAVGHKGVPGGGQLNQFGMDFATEGYKWTKHLCVLDSDGDGQTNGCELGDPLCSWAEGQTPKFLSEISHPGLQSSTTNRTDDCPLRVVSHLPITPHSGWISLSAVLVPLVLAALLGSIITNVASARQSAFGKKMLYERGWRRSCLQLLASCNNRLSFTFPRKISSPGKPEAKKTSNKKTRSCWHTVIDTSLTRWLMNLYVGEFLFFFAVALGLLALVALKQGLKHNVANTLGQLASTLCFLVVLPVSRTSLWIVIFGIPFERALQWHRVFGRLFAGSVVLHLVVVIWRYGLAALTATLQFGPSKDAPYPFYGFLCGISVLLIALTSMGRIRRRCYRVFYFFHLPLLMIVAVTAILHAPGSEYRYPVGIAFGMWFLDRVLLSYIFRTFKCVNVETEVYAAANVVELTLYLDKPVEVLPGAYFDITIPEINQWKSHPFSVSYQKEKNELTFHIKSWGVKGSFTDKLRKLVAKSDTIKLNPVLQGPYGSLSVRLEEYDSIWICAGGIGITPLLNTAMKLLSDKRDGVLVNFVWATKHTADLTCFQDQLEQIDRAKGFNLRIYVTRGMSGGEHSLSPDQVGMNESELLSAKEEIVSLRDSGIGNSALTVRKGRPNFSRLFHESSSEKECALVCGPEAMMNEVQTEGDNHGFHIHKECFFY